MTRVPLTIAPDHPAFEGHFPGRPIVPGVVLLDRSLQAIAAHCDIPPDRQCAGRWQVAQAKFLSFVGPGDPVHVEFETTAVAEHFRLRVLAGDATDERIAMVGSVAFLGPGTAS